MNVTVAAFAALSFAWLLCFQAGATKSCFSCLAEASHIRFLESFLQSLL